MSPLQGRCAPTGANVADVCLWCVCKIANLQLSATADGAKSPIFDLLSGGGNAAIVPNSEIKYSEETR